MPSRRDARAGGPPTTLATPSRPTQPSRYGAEPSRRTAPAKAPVDIPRMLEELAFTGEWRRYQRMAIEAFERDRKAGRTNTHIVAPPGSGKTLLGVELIRRIGKRALVLAPNSAIQMQWPRAVRQFTRDTQRRRDRAGVPDRVPELPVAGPARRSRGGARAARREPLGGRARAGDRRAAGGGRARGERASRARRRTAGASEIGRISAAIKREIARGEHEGVQLADLLSAPARERVRRLAAAQVGAIVLDECHHLASLWGYVVRAVLDEIGGERARDRPHRHAALGAHRRRAGAVRRDARARSTSRSRRPPSSATATSRPTRSSRG